MNPFWFLNRKLTKELRIIQIPFTEHYYIANSYGKPLMYGIVEWAISDDYVYGYCTRKDEDYFIFSRKNHNAKFYTKKEESKWESDIDELGLKMYCLDIAEGLAYLQYRGERKYPIK